MEKIDLFMGVSIDPNIEYFVQVLNVGIEGKVRGVEGDKLFMVNGREYDLREVIGFGYEATKKYDFAKREVPINSIRTFYVLRNRQDQLKN